MYRDILNVIEGKEEFHIKEHQNLEVTKRQSSATINQQPKTVRLKINGDAVASPFIVILRFRPNGLLSLWHAKPYFRNPWT